MAMASKLAHQLRKETSGLKKSLVEDDRLDDIYQIITKIESKNLMQVEFLAFLIQKGFAKNSQKIHTFVDIYEEAQSKEGKLDEPRKFGKANFVKALHIIAERVYPGEPQAFEKIVYPRITSNEALEDVRLKMDDGVRKMLANQVLKLWRDHDREMQILFEAYLPENFNEGMGFYWKEIRYLEKKLPIICMFRMLYEAEIIPHYITPSHFLECASKLLPPLSHISGTNQKEALFYSPEAIINYSKEAVNQKKIKLLEGDIGLTFFDFSVLLTRLSFDISKDKSDAAKSLLNLFSIIKLKETIACKGQVKSKPNRFEDVIRNFFLAENKKGNRNSFQPQRRDTKKKIEQILDFGQNLQDESKNQFQWAKISEQEFREIKRSIDEDHLPEIPPPPQVEKENDSNYQVSQNHVVIGEQLPKIQDKNKPAVKKNDKKEEQSNQYKLEVQKTEDLSSDHFHEILAKPHRQRSNAEYPIILTQALYPTDIPSLSLPPKAELYLETTYIHLGEKNYEKAFLNFCKAKAICENIKSPINQYFFAILEAQIYEAAGRDSIALLNYHKAKEISCNISNKDTLLRCYAYRCLASCLYHLEEYQYALQCFLKVKDFQHPLWSNNSVKSAFLENNIGCCYMIMNRNNEACQYFELAHSIMDLHLGRFNERTLIAEQNGIKNKKAFIQNPPAYHTMWRTYQEKPGLQKEVAKKGGKKK